MKTVELNILKEELAHREEFKKFLDDKKIKGKPLDLAEKVLVIETILTAIKSANLREIRNENAMILTELKSQPLFFDRISSKSKRFLRALSLYKKPVLTQAQWLQDIRFYQLLPENLRFYNLDSSGKVTLNKRCEIGTGRTKFLEKELNKIGDGNSERPIHYLTKTTDETRFYVKYDNDGEYRYEAKKILPCYEIKDEELLFDEDKYQIKPLKEKKYAKISKKINMRELLDLISEEPGILPLIEMEFIDEDTVEIILDKVVHIVGGLGVGKSNFKHAFTKYLIDNNLVNRIAIVEDKVSTVFDIVKKLREYGIDAVPVVGKNEEKYLKDYLATLDGNLSDICDDKIVEWITGNCFVEDTVDMLNASKVYEKRNYCEQFEEGELKNCVCPYISICGKMQRYRDMNESKVWVISTAALIATTIPTPFNPRKQTMFELVYDCCDLVFIDEVDGAQKYLDETLVEEKVIFKAKSLVSDLKKLESRTRKTYENSPEISNLYHSISNFIKGVNHFNDLSVFSKYAIQILAKEKMITPKTVVEGILKYIKPNKAFQEELRKLSETASSYRYDEEKEKEIIQNLEENAIYVAYKMFNATSHASYYLIEDKYESIFNKIKNYCDSFNIEYTTDVPDTLDLLSKPRLYNLNQKMNKFYTKRLGDKAILLGGSIDSGLTIEDRVERDILIREMLLFLIILIELDHNYKQIILNCEIIRNKDQEEVQLDVNYLTELSFYQNPTSLFTYEPLLEETRGYSLKKLKKGDNNYELQYTAYSGVGRQLIHHLNNVKEPLGQKGPGVIGLSGTSYLPGSPHFNFNVPPSILLSPVNENGEKKKEGRIDMEYVMVNSKNGGYVFVSGNGEDSDKRKGAYKEIIESDVFQNKLRYAIRKTNKKAMIVVASYEDAKYVQTILKNQGFSTICLMQEGVDDDTYTTIYKSEVEQIAFNEEYKDKDCFIVGAKTIYRGYNILDEERNSYFGSAFFLSRPYTPPHSYKNAITVTHAKDELFIKEYLENSENNSKYFLSYDDKRTQLNKGIFEKFYEMGKWDDLDIEQKKAVSAEAFSYIKQMIGRLQRGQNDCLVYFFDSAFCPFKQLENLNTEEGDSMFDYWKLIIEEAIKENRVIGEALYMGFYQALEEMLSKTHRRNY